MSTGAVVHGFEEGHSNEDEVSVEAVVCVEGARVGGGKGFIVSGATDGRACIWDLATYKLRTVLSHSSDVRPSSHPQLSDVLTRGKRRR